MMFAVLIVICIVIVFAAYLFFNAVICTKKAYKTGEKKKYYSDEEINIYASRLAEMIKCKTVSVKGSFDSTEFDRLHTVLEKLFPEVHKTAERMIFSDDCLIYKIPGKDTSRNIMLMSHHDVVAADGKWEYDAFSGEIADGKIRGRGTVDTKTPLFAEFSAVEELLSENYEFPCNVWIGSSHNEELGGDGIPEALKYFKEKSITFDVILDEGGAIIEPPLANMNCDKCAMIAVHEKGRYYISCTAEAGNAHSSLTSAASASVTERMAAFINEIQTKDIFIKRMNPQITAMFTHLAPYCSFGMKLIFANLKVFSPLLKKLLPKINAQAGSLIGTTCSFTEIEGSTESKKCTATAFLKPVNSADFKLDLEAFNSVAKKYSIATKVQDRSEYHEPADMEKPQFEYTKKCIHKIFPQYPVSPFILPAGTDARTLTDICPCVLRFAPIRLSKQQLDSVHSENENIDIDAVADCVMFYKHFLKNYK